MAKEERAEVKPEEKFEVENAHPVIQVTCPTKHAK